MNTSNGDMPVDRNTLAFRVREPPDAEHDAPAGDVPPAALTTMLKAVRGTVVTPSETLMMMLLKVPSTDGVPVSEPVVALNDAQFGLFWMLKDSVAPVPPAAVGVNAYTVPTVAVVEGVPTMVGGTVTVVLIELEPAVLVQVSV
jgi:hypothetical protein